VFELLGWSCALHRCSATEQILGIVKFHQSSTHETRQVPEYQMMRILVEVLTGNFLLLYLYFGCTTNQSDIPFGYFLLLLFHGHKVLFYVFWSIHSERSSWRRSVDTTVVDVQTLLRHF
jgi:hypothetical protein